MILKPNVLDYWRKFDSSEGTEMGKIFDLIEPKFDRLTGLCTPTAVRAAEPCG